jgi:hypothetical protein
MLSIGLGVTHTTIIGSKGSGIVGGQVAGVTGTGQLGNVSIIETLALAGLASTTGLGSVTVTATWDGLVNGNAAIGELGTVSIVETVAPAGLSSTVDVGTVVPITVVAPEGLSSTSAVGTVIPEEIIAVTGLSSTGTAGTVTTTGGTATLGTPTLLNASAGGSTQAVSGSFTPTANARLFALMVTRKNTSPSATPTITDSASLTWTEAVLFSNNFGSNPDLVLRVMKAAAPSSPSSMTVTADCTDSAAIGLVVFEITDASTTITNTKTAVASSGTYSLTMDSSPGANSALIAVGTQPSSTTTEATGFTEIRDGQHAGVSLTSYVAYDKTSPTSGAHTFTQSTGQNGIMAMFEVTPA